MKFVKTFPYQGGVANVYETEDGGLFVEVKRPGQPDKLISLSDESAMFEDENMIVSLEEGLTRVRRTTPVSFDPNASPFIRSEAITKGTLAGGRFYLSEESYVDVFPGSEAGSGVTAYKAALHIDNAGHMTFSLPDADETA